LSLRIFLYLTFHSTCHGAHPVPHSFPTRRSSDLRSNKCTHWSRDRTTCPESWCTYLSSGSAVLFLASASSVSRRIISVSRIRARDRKSTRLNSSHLGISYAVFCLKKKTKKI